MKWEQDLTRDIRTNTSFDDEDEDRGIQRHYHGAVEFSDCNRSNLAEQFFKIRDNCTSILEIGVCRNQGASSTWTFLDNKLDTTAYVGIDLDDKSFLNNPDKRIYTIKNSSSDIKLNMGIINALGIQGFDFIFIDGWHSINQVLVDWEYTQWLNPGGIVAFHDVSCHPGPARFVQALNKDIWNVVENTCPSDWGIGFAWKK